MNLNMLPTTDNEAQTLSLLRCYNECQVIEKNFIS